MKRYQRRLGDAFGVLAAIRAGLAVLEVLFLFVVLPSTRATDILVLVARLEFGAVAVLLLAHLVSRRRLWSRTTLVALDALTILLVATFAGVAVAMWCLISVVAAAAVSRVVYGMQAELREASRVGQYTLEKKIGEGGLGVVYRARHALLRRPTAIKMLRPEQVGLANLQRFEREVQATSRLTHPNIVSVYDYGRTREGVFYYVMEHTDGVSLQQLVERDGPLSPARVVDVLTQIAAALGEAHALGLVHRDVKPPNVMMCERGGGAREEDHRPVQRLDRDRQRVGQGDDRDGDTAEICAVETFGNIAARGS